MCVCVLLCTTVIHNTAQSSSDYLPFYSPDKHQSSDAAHWRGGGDESNNEKLEHRVLLGAWAVTRDTVRWGLDRL